MILFTLFMHTLALSWIQAFSAEFDQLLSERYAVRNCYAKIAAKRINSIRQCPKYARAHIDLYPAFISDDSKESACLAIKGVLDLLKSNYPMLLTRQGRAKEIVNEHCA